MDNKNYLNQATGGAGPFESRAQNSDFKTSPREGINTYGAPVGKRVYDIDKKDIVFFFIFAVLSFLTLRLGVLGGFGLGFSVTATVIACCVAAFVYDKNAKGKASYFILLLIVLLFCISFFFNNDPLIKLLDTAALFIVGFMCFNGLSSNAFCRDGSYKELLEGLYCGIIKPLENIAVPFSSFKSVSKSEKNKALFQALIGVGVSLPLLIVIVSLLVSSDVAFENLLTRLFSDIFKLVTALILTLLVVPVLYSYGLVLRKKAAASEKIKTDRIEGALAPATVNTVLSVVSAAYILYLVSQLAYITKAFSFLLPNDYSSSRFAREGFFQMLVVAAINLALIWVSSVLVKRRENGKTPAFTTALNAFLCLFTLFYIATAFLKMAQYISRFGFTYLRVTASVFMIMLAVIMIFAFIGLFTKKLPVVRCAVICVSAALLLLSFVDVNCLVSKVNYRLYSEKKITLDAEDVYKYEPEELLKLFSCDDKKIKYAAYENLCALYGMNLSDEEYEDAANKKTDVLGLNTPKILSDASLEKHRARFEKESAEFEKEVFEASERGEDGLYINYVE